jgi:chemotaxis protein MotA
LASSVAVLKQETPLAGRRRNPLDISMLVGMAIALAATVAGVAATGVKLTYFFQPTGACIVLGGTLGVTIITTPRRNLAFSLQRVWALIRAADADRSALIEEILIYVKSARSHGLLNVEPMLEQASDPFLKEAMLLAIDIRSRDEIRTVLETKARLRERQGEMDARVLEVAGGFSPTIGVMGTVVGLIEVLRNFSDLSSVAAGIGAAFVSTIYGLGLANMVLLPAAHRIRARVAERLEMQELMIEGTIGVAQGMHPSLVAERLNAFLRDEVK